MSQQTCRYCLSESEEPLIWPCNCIQGVHGHCIKTWLQTKQRYWECEICAGHYRAQAIHARFGRLNWLYALLLYPLFDILILFNLFGTTYPNPIESFWLSLVGFGVGLVFAISFVCLLCVINMRMFHLLNYGVVDKRGLMIMAGALVTIVIVQMAGVLTVYLLQHLAVWNFWTFGIGSIWLSGIILLLGMIGCMIWMAIQCRGYARISAYNKQEEA